MGEETVADVKDTVAEVIDTVVEEVSATCQAAKDMKVTAVAQCDLATGSVQVQCMAQIELGIELACSLRDRRQVSGSGDGEDGDCSNLKGALDTATADRDSASDSLAAASEAAGESSAATSIGTIGTIVAAGLFAALN
jgi:hypothetical protein